MHNAQCTINSYDRGLKNSKFKIQNSKFKTQNKSHSLQITHY